MHKLAIRLGIFVIFGVAALVARPFVMGGASDLKVGECFDVPAQTETVKKVQHHPCSDPHGAEVYYIGTMPTPDGAPYPDDAVLAAIVGSQCASAFDTYTGLSYATDETWQYGAMLPVSKNWAKGDRRLTCYARRIDRQPTTNSIKKS